MDRIDAERIAAAIEKLSAEIAELRREIAALKAARPVNWPAPPAYPRYPAPRARVNAIGGSPYDLSLRRGTWE